MTVEHAACRSCRRQVHLQYVWVVTEYDVLAKDLLWRLKFSRARAAAVVVARILDERLPYFTPDTIISHIPTATSRFRARGYDHATLIAKELARQRNVRHCTLLARMGQTRQVGAKRAQRRHQLQGAFRAVPARLDPKTPVVLIDDVLTTGATIEAATAVLRAAGLKSVRAAVFAQKIQT